MKNKDQEALKNLYEDIYKKDYLRCENPDKYDWQDFSDHKYSGGFSCFLIESFEKIATQPTKQGEEDVYNIVLRDGLQFTLNMNYINAETSKEYPEKKALNASHKGREDIADLYESSFSGVEGRVCVIQFMDSENRQRQTGEVGVAAVELFGLLRNAILDSIKNNKYQNLSALVIRVSNSEPKRISLYSKMLKKYLSHEFPNVFVDDFSEQEDKYTLVVAAK